MSYDLRAGLGDLGAAERATPAELPVPALRARARRRRAIRIAAACSGALVAAAGIAVAAVALPDAGPVPPAATATPTWTPDASGWPPAVTLDGPTPTCGEAMPDLIDPQQEPVVVVEDVLQDGPLVAGGVAQVDVTIHGPEGFGLTVDTAHLLLARDGVVVAAVGAGTSHIQYGTDIGVVTQPSPTLELVRCETQGRGGDPLAPGEYELYVAVDLLRDGAAIGQVERLTIAGGPYTVTIDPGL